MTHERLESCKFAGAAVEFQTNKGRVFKYENYGYSDTMAMMQDLAGISFVYDNLLFLTA